jgi:hypothetical protein
MANLKYAPHNEPDGEGNGWADCAPEAATAWIVFDDDLTDDSHFEIVNLFETEDAAKNYIAKVAA